MAKPKVSKETQQLFLKLLNFTPDLLAKTQHEAKLHNTSFDALVRAAVEKYVNALTVAREQREAEFSEYARMLLYAHFKEDRNEFLTADAICAIGQTPAAIGDGKSQ